MNYVRIVVDEKILFECHKPHFVIQVPEDCSDKCVVKYVGRGYTCSGVRLRFYSIFLVRCFGFSNYTANVKL